MHFSIVVVVLVLGMLLDGSSRYRWLPGDLSCRMILVPYRRTQQEVGFLLSGRRAVLPGRLLFLFLQHNLVDFAALV